MIQRAMLILLALLSLLVDEAQACSRIGGASTLEETVIEANEIFVARLVSAREKFLHVEGEVEPYIEGEYRLIETLKGTPPRKGKVHDFPYGPGNCSLGLMVGWDYVFMVSKDPEWKKHRWVGMFSGSFPLGSYRDANDVEEPELVSLRSTLKTLDVSKQ